MASWREGVVILVRVLDGSTEVLPGQHLEEGLADSCGTLVVSIEELAANRCELAAARGGDGSLVLGACIALEDSLLEEGLDNELA